jgi:hypothetical protein
LIVESFESLRTAPIRQNSGRASAETKVKPPWGPALGKGVGGVNAPAAILWARMIVVSGSHRALRLSQVAAALAIEVGIRIPTVVKIAPISFNESPLQALRRCNSKKGSYQNEHPTPDGTPDGG